MFRRKKEEGRRKKEEEKKEVRKFGNGCYISLGRTGVINPVYS